MRIPKELTTVTPLSKLLALIIFLTFPIYGFLLGAYFQHLADLNNSQSLVINYNINRDYLDTSIIAPITCSSNHDCPAGYHCAPHGPIVLDSQTPDKKAYLACLKNNPSRR